MTHRDVLLMKKLPNFTLNALKPRQVDSMGFSSEATFLAVQCFSADMHNITLKCDFAKLCNTISDW